MEYKFKNKLNKKTFINSIELWNKLRGLKKDEFEKFVDESYKLFVEKEKKLEYQNVIDTSHMMAYSKFKNYYFLNLLPFILAILCLPFVPLTKILGWVGIIGFGFSGFIMMVIIEVLKHKYQRKSLASLYTELDEFYDSVTFDD